MEVIVVDTNTDRLERLILNRNLFLEYVKISVENIRDKCSNTENIEKVSELLGIAEFNQKWKFEGWANKFVEKIIDQIGCCLIIKTKVSSEKSFQFCKKEMERLMIEIGKDLSFFIYDTSSRFSCLKAFKELDLNLFECGDLVSEGLTTIRLSAIEIINNLECAYKYVV